MKKATQQLTKQHNRNLVLKTVFDNDQISRAEIARITSLTRTTVSDIVSDLMKEGLVEEVGLGSSLGGKSPILLSLVADSRHLIGLDLGQNQFTGVIVNLRGKINNIISIPAITPQKKDPLEMIYEILDQLLESSTQSVVGISIGTPGLVNTEEGLVINAVNLGWKNLPLAKLLKERYGLLAYVVNDSQAAAMGEYSFGMEKKTEGNLIVINVGNGIGAGIILNGKLFHGEGGGSGEIGHIVVVHENGELCRCGHHGCLETVASARALISHAQSAYMKNQLNIPVSTPEDIDLDVIENAFHSGDPVAHRLITEAGQYLGRAIASLVGTLNIQNIVLIGDMTRFGSKWLETIRSTMKESCLSGLAQNTHIKVGTLGKNVIALGASALLANNYDLLFNRQD